VPAKPGGHCRRRVQPEHPARDATAPRGGGVPVPPARLGGNPRHLPPPSAGAGAAMRLARREKVFGQGHAVPLDKTQKARIQAYAKAWSARHCRPGQHHGPITMAFRRVLAALLWGFHNSRSGCCFPSYERIAEQAECARSTVAEALKVLEFA